MYQQPNQKPTTEDDDAGPDTALRPSRGRAAARERPTPCTLGVHQASVLLAEDDADMRTFLSVALQQEGYAVEEVQDGTALLDRIADGLLANSKLLPDIIVSDVRMPGWSGIDVLSSLRQADWAMPVILITAFGDAKTHAQARQLGASTLLDKPFDIEELLRAVGAILPARF